MLEKNGESKMNKKEDKQRNVRFSRRKTNLAKQNKNEAMTVDTVIRRDTTKNYTIVLKGTIGGKRRIERLRINCMSQIIKRYESRLVQTTRR